MSDYREINDIFGFYNDNFEVCSNKFENCTDIFQIFSHKFEVCTEKNLILVL